MRAHATLVLLGLLVLAGCGTTKPDYTIRVAKTPTGMQAIPPDCPSWVTETTDPYDNQPLPQFGCANARNLAMQVERPEDLLHGRQLGTASGVTALGSMLRYNGNQPRGLVDPQSATDSSLAITSAPVPSSLISGEAPNGGSSSSSSSSSAAGSAAAP